MIGAKIRKQNKPGENNRIDLSNEKYLQTVWRRFRKHHLAAVSLVVLIVIVGAALLAPVIAPYDPNELAGPFNGHRQHSSGLARIRSAGMCSADFCMRPEYRC